MKGSISRVTLCLMLVVLLAFLAGVAPAGATCCKQCCKEGEVCKRCAKITDGAPIQTTPPDKTCRVICRVWDEASNKRVFVWAKFERVNEVRGYQKLCTQTTKCTTTGACEKKVYTKPCDGTWTKYGPWKLMTIGWGASPCSA